VLVANASQFPGGIKALADHAHAAGFKFGIYTDRGTQTCGGRPGALGHEQLDANTYAALGVDFLKEDSCYADDTPDVAWPQYAKMRDALNATGRPIYFNLCGWHSWYAPVGAALGNSWRTGGDDVNWAGILSNIDIASELAQYASPGTLDARCWRALLLTFVAQEHSTTPTIFCFKMPVASTRRVRSRRGCSSVFTPCLLRPSSSVKTSPALKPTPSFFKHF
jgi:hypothetical protein